MWNNPVIANTVRFLLLVLAQVLLFNNVNFLGSIYPFVYILFFYWYPMHKNRSVFLLVSFFLGFVIDLFSDTLALNAVASLTVAYARPTLLRFCFGVNFDYQGFTFKSSTLVQRMTFLMFLALLHHLVFFSLEILSFSHILLILKKILFTGILTFISCTLLSSLFAVEKD